MNVVDQQCADGDNTQIDGTSATGLVREALAEDIPALVSLEEACFNSDRLSRRSFRHFVTEGNSVILIDQTADQARGYVTLLFRADVSLARVYSIATAPDWLGKGVASGLLRAAEELALAHSCVGMRLEIRKDNLASQQLFLRHGYSVFGEHAGYCEDGMDALRFEKSLTARLRPELARTTYYRQTLGLTCGASCLMMAMKAFDRELVVDRTLEVQLWREATTIYMTAGHGGCSPYGLALAANKRGYPTGIYVNGDGVPDTTAPYKVVTAAQFLSSPDDCAAAGTTVINLCRSYKYLQLIRRSVITIGPLHTWGRRAAYMRQRERIKTALQAAATTAKSSS